MTNAVDTVIVYFKCDNKIFKIAIFYVILIDQKYLNYSHNVF